jgi:histidyl-tRNA synthetase
MTQIIQAVRGMNDILPNQTPHWHYLETSIRKILTSYGFKEIRLPLVEKSNLFSRSIGEVTDIVEKEMYSFTDKADKNQQAESLSLRPEGTASCVRAGIQHQLFYGQIQKLWYAGPMFRRERPQKGRYRQFHQIGAEVFGVEAAEADAELILLTARLWRKLNLTLKLEINSLGDAASRANYRNILQDYFNQHTEQLDADSLRRLQTNPLRILDSKNPAMQELITSAPQLINYLDAESLAHFNRLQHLLAANGIDFNVNPRLVRGLDYYNRTVFEWTTEELGAQGTVCAGGRYDGLVAQLGGQNTPALGFALGMERLISLIHEEELIPTHVYLMPIGEEAKTAGLILAENLRNDVPELNLLLHSTGGTLKNQLKKADKSGAHLGLILAEDELNNGQIKVKFLRTAQEQQSLTYAQLVNLLNTYI